MTLLIWRQSRLPVAAAAAVLTGLAILLIVTGVPLHHAYQEGLATCRASGSCGDLQKQLFRKQGTIIGIINLTIAAPAVIGMFLGAPLAARDLEQHTSKLIWTQAVTRRRWLTVKLAWLGGIALAWSASIAALVTWWSGPLNALGHLRFWPGQFDIQGIVPAAYALFAFAVGVTAGLLVRRTVIALGIALAVFAATRLLITTYLRPHYLAPATAALKPGPHTAYNSQGNWTLGTRANSPIRAVKGHGHVLPHHLSHAACQSLSRFACLAARGIRQIFTYQPATRYWTFQGIETALYLLLTTALIIASMAALRRAEG